MASMASSSSSSKLLSSFFFFVLCLKITAKKTYIVQMKHQEKPLSFETHHDWYSSNLQSLSDSPSESLLYSYASAYSGFAASLDEQQAESLSKSDSVLGVYEDTVYTLHTTRTPRFLGLDTHMGLWAGPNTQQLEQASRDVIIGVLDTGVWPESKSFDDSGMPEIPSKWRGECYTIDHVKTIAKRPNITCSKRFKDPGELNYPSFSVLFGDKRVVRYSRELTNVGPARSIYKVGVNAPSSVGISVRPRTLVFRHIGEKKRYTVSFVAKRIRSMVRPEFGSIVWGNAQYQVKSPVSFAWTLL
ncbi:hypothetical protein V6N12_042314 [Hibiscus sabdariffa]|uniref:Uncharacterized protein n=1 Tax=Hibiscus sabdariffa TaxID=183260 RepID=A0ABR2EEF1_9ROSI